MKTDYVLRRRVLLGISALFCTTLLLFGCENNSTIPVGPELDNLEFSDGADGLSKRGSGGWLLGTTRNGELLQIDLGGGTVQLIGDAGVFDGRALGWTGLSFDKDGNLGPCL